MEMINIDDTTLFCHTNGKVTIKCVTPLDCDKDVLVGYNTESTLYHDCNLFNEWYIAKYYYDLITGKVKRGIGENTLVRIDKLVQHINLDEADVFCEYHNIPITKKLLKRKNCVFHSKVCKYVKIKNR